MTDMTSTVLQVGTGVVVIVIVWIAALVAGAILLRADGSAKLGVIPTTLLALTITLVLVFFPRSPETPLPFKEIEEMVCFSVDASKSWRTMALEDSQSSHFNGILLSFPCCLPCGYEIVDTFFIGRYVLLAVVGTVFLVAFFMLLPLHFLAPVHSKALRTY